eukprot:395820-Rhodomonas_salina.2
MPKRNADVARHRRVREVALQAHTDVGVSALPRAGHTARELRQAWDSASSTRQRRQHSTQHPQHTHAHDAASSRKHPHHNTAHASSRSSWRSRLTWRREMGSF